ncbi:MAG TPA: ATP-dependent DNA ligase [Acidobacteriaceae bacterium]|nr:ATP-dependent DNA ligase [Acidobacteriaceae bacterium]
MALFADLANLAEGLSSEASRLKKRDAIAGSVGQLASSTVEVDPLLQAGRFCLYLAGQPFPEADARRLNAGGAILSRALKTVSGATDAAMNAAYRKHGDLGAAAYDLLVAPYGRAPSQATLELSAVAQAFDDMASARTTAARSATVEDLLRRATALEAKYLLKLMLGDMRIGVKQSLVEEGIALAAHVAVEAVRHAVMLEADLQRAVARAFAGTLDQARMTLFHPLGFMLASPVETPEEAVERFTATPKKAPAAKPPKSKSRKKAVEQEEPAGDDAALLPVDAAEQGFTEDVELEAVKLEGAPGADAGTPAAIHAFLEDKFDGIRAQVHCGDPAQLGRVAVYSRSREDVTESFPEIGEAFRDVVARPGGLILDGEILGWDVAADRALPFAVLGQRIGRKRVSDDLRREIPVVFMAFDLLYAGGELLLPRPLRERRALLENTVLQLQGSTSSGIAAAVDSAQHDLFAFAAPSSKPVQRLLLSRAEMVESADGVDRGYRDARARSNEGVMLKAAGSAYLPGRRGLAWLKLKRELATLDVVITGAEFGSGKRAQFLSDYTFAVRGPGGQLLNLGKAYQGVTDAEITELTEWLKAHTLEDFGHFRTVEPLRVLEVAFNNIMRSDRHASGFALRFPRILRLRDDKPVEEIDTLERVEEVYGSQPDKPVEG